MPGVSGRMGSLIAQKILQTKDMQLTSATVRDTNELLGQKVANSDVVINNNLSAADFDVVIDFTLPESVLQHINYCVSHNKAMVIGATGFDDKQLHVVKEAAKQIPIVLAANMSIGVNICYKMLAAASKMLDKSWQISIDDTHHKNKKDAPSGTSKQFAKVINDNINHKTEIQFSSQRLEEVVGIHTVSIKNQFEEIIVGHIANDRSIYAEGAIVAARWVYNKQPGLYSMQDVLS